MVTVADRLCAEVRYPDGRVQSIRLGEIAGLVNQRGNPDNVKWIDWVWITVPSPHVPAGTEMVDTPGTGVGGHGQLRRVHPCQDVAALLDRYGPERLIDLAAAKGRRSWAGWTTT